MRYPELCKHNETKEVVKDRYQVQFVTIVTVIAVKCRYCDRTIGIRTEYNPIEYLVVQGPVVP